MLLWTGDGLSCTPNTRSKARNATPCRSAPFKTAGLMEAKRLSTALAIIACLLEIVSCHGKGGVWDGQHSHFACSFRRLLPINLHAVIKRAGGEDWLYNLKHGLAYVLITLRQTDATKTFEGVLPVRNILAFGFSRGNLFSEVLACNSNDKIPRLCRLRAIERTVFLRRRQADARCLHVESSVNLFGRCVNGCRCAHTCMMVDEIEVC